MNKKYIFIGIAILIIIVIIIAITLILVLNKTKVTYSTLKSTDDKFSIELPSNIEYKVNSENSNNFTIDLYSVKDGSLLRNLHAGASI